MDEEVPQEINERLSGQDRFRRNVIFAWAGFLVNVVAGFIMPRLISNHLGQTTLGIWDFAWSVVNYFGLVHLSIGGSVQRYVAKYRTEGNVKSLSESVSTIGLSLKISGFLAILLTVATVLWIIPLFGASLGSELRVARLVVLLLGLEIAFSTMLTVYGGILVGCHRWDAHNLINAVCYVAMTVGMIAAVVSGRGLPTLAAIHMTAMTCGELARWYLARRVCPEFIMDYRLARWATWKEQAHFSAKSMVPRIADLISNQSLAMLITLFLGPPALAIYSRPRNLMRQGQTLAARFGSILIPTASSLDASADKVQLRTTFYKSTFFMSVLAMPVVWAFALFGDDLIRLWMGRNYVYHGLMPVLALGCFPSLVQEPVFSMLAGINKHGLLAMLRLVASVVSAVLLGVGLAFFHWNLLEAALAFALPPMIVDSMIGPAVACRALEVSLAKYYRNTFLKPLIGAVPFVACLEVTRWTFSSRPLVALLFAGLAALTLAAVVRMAFSNLRHEAAQQPAPLARRLAKEQDASFAAGAARISSEFQDDGPKARALSSSRIVVGFRNDDPSALSNVEHEREIYEIFERYGVAQTLGIIPNVALGDHHDPNGHGERVLFESERMLEFLKEYTQRSGSEIAQHGYTHRANRFSLPKRREYSEFKSLPMDEQEEMVRKGAAILEKAFGARPVAFIPPWNRWDNNTVTACAKSNFRIISAGPFVAPDSNLVFLGVNSDLANFPEYFRAAKQTSRRVFLTVLFHSATLTAEQKKLLIAALEIATNDDECRTGTLTEMGLTFRDELKYVNEAGRNVVPLYQVPDSIRARAWPYIMIRPKVSPSLPSLLNRGKELYLAGDYSACRELTAQIDRVCSKVVFAGRAFVFLGGVALGGLIMFWTKAASAFGDAKLTALFLLALLPLVVSGSARRMATAKNTQSEVVVAGVFGASGLGLSFCLTLLWRILGNQ